MFACGQNNSLSSSSTSVLTLQNGGSNIVRCPRNGRKSLNLRYYETLNLRYFVSLTCAMQVSDIWNLFCVYLEKENSLSQHTIYALLFVRMDDLAKQIESISARYNVKMMSNSNSNSNNSGVSQSFVRSSSGANLQRDKLQEFCDAYNRVASAQKALIGVYPLAASEQEEYIREVLFFEWAPLVRGLEDAAAAADSPTSQGRVFASATQGAMQSIKLFAQHLEVASAYTSHVLEQEYKVFCDNSLELQAWLLSQTNTHLCKLAKMDIGVRSHMHLKKNPFTQCNYAVPHYVSRRDFADYAQIVNSSRDSSWEKQSDKVMRSRYKGQYDEYIYMCTFGVSCKVHDVVMAHFTLKNMQVSDFLTSSGSENGSGGELCNTLSLVAGAQECMYRCGSFVYKDANERLACFCLVLCDEHPLSQAITQVTKGNMSVHIYGVSDTQTRIVITSDYRNVARFGAPKKKNERTSINMANAHFKLIRQQIKHVKKVTLDNLHEHASHKKIVTMGESYVLAHPQQA